MACKKLLWYLKSRNSQPACFLEPDGHAATLQDSTSLVSQELPRHHTGLGLFRQRLYTSPLPRSLPRPSARQEGAENESKQSFPESPHVVGQRELPLPLRAEGEGWEPLGQVAYKALNSLTSTLDLFFVSESGQWEGLPDSTPTPTPPMLPALLFG